MLSLFLFSGCATLGSKSDVEQISQELAKLKQDMVRLEMIAGAGGAAANFYPARGLDGGAAGDLDAIAGTEDKDVGFVVLENDATYGNTLLVYVLNSTSGDGDDLPWYLDAADNNDGAGGNQERWELAFVGGVMPSESDADGETVVVPQAYGGVIYESGASQTILLPDNKAGMSFCVIMDAAQSVLLDSNANDNFEIDGVTGDNGDYITNSTAAKGDFACVYSIDGISWVLIGRNGDWIHES